MNQKKSFNLFAVTKYAIRFENLMDNFLNSKQAKL